MKKVNPDNSLGFILNRTNTRMKNALLHKFRDYDLTPEQWAVLNRLWVKEGVTPKELADLTCKDQPTTVRMLAKLQNKGYITREVNPEDSRSFLIYLTSKGREAKDILFPLAFEVLNEATRGIEAEQLEAAKSILNQIYRNLESQR
ncbi:Multidrug resistance operon repressor [Sporotomaculum syntrophicum]|uniref:Multidrug resistance operon repressor n=1 Tax=Sporotomaculum syntrophicum TaxID=182264 RepID=A0A9D3AW45_9FIRM|nr:MarR family transcriptional regulator [Sporotomaculum syntrophicum]KAF1084955.1 Multidrug resistance operon repressor [Sporotomaculum syntrophicum]